MGRKASPAVIGAFVLGGLVLFVVALLVWGSGTFFRHTVPYVLYFPGSVNGLVVGAPVKFRGVQIGQVTDLRLRYAQTAGLPRIPVFVEIDADLVRQLGEEEGPTDERLHGLIAQGLRARLQTMSVVTGVLYVEFDLEPGAPLEMVQGPDASPIEIPTLPTPLEEATKTVSDVLTQLKQIDFKGIGAQVQEAVASVNRILTDPRLDQAVAQLPQTLAAARELVTNLDRRTGPIAQDLRATTTAARQTLASLEATLEGVQGLLAPEAPLSVEMTRTVTDLGRAARALRDLADLIERDPSSVVFGRRTD